MSISDVVMRLTMSAYRRIQKNRGTLQPIWQCRFYDRVLRYRAEFDDIWAYIHQNPVRKDWSKSQKTGGGPVQGGLLTEAGRSRSTTSECRSTLRTGFEQKPERAPPSAMM